MNRLHSKIILILLIASTLVVFWQVRNHDFVNLDDIDYVTGNDQVGNGWTKDGIRWAFTSTLHGHWHPLTWLSHMTDCQLFGMNPGRHHLVSVLLHVINTILLFQVLSGMTKETWRSAFVAALFALHPLHVEPVCWVSDRKDVLSTLFWMLAAGAYFMYTKKPGLSRYLLVLGAFLLGLLAKPVVVTLPFVLLLLDYWPLKRFATPPSKGEEENENLEDRDDGPKAGSLFHLFWEKALFFIVAGIFVFIAVSVMKSGKLPNLGAQAMVPAEIHFDKALFHYAVYMGKLFWPVDLAIPYLEPSAVTNRQLWGSALILMAVTILVFWKGRRHPYLPTGWLWYILTLLPASGLVKGGPYVIADRYTYVPLIGLFIMIAWGVPDLLEKWRHRRLALGLAALLVIIGLLICTWIQIGHWKDSVTLFTHTIKVTKNNYVGHNNLGFALMKQDRFPEAKEHLLEALRLKPEYAKAHNNLGVTSTKLGEIDEALSHFSEAVRIMPDLLDAHNNLGVILKKQGRLEEAARHFSEVLRIKPDSARAHNSMGILMARRGQTDEAAEHFSEAVKSDPDYAEAHNNLGVVLKRQGKLEEATAYFSKAVRIEPGYAEAHNNLGVMLQKKGRPKEAMSHFSEAIRLDPNYAEAHNNLGVLLERQGRLEEAKGHFSEALRIRPGYEKARENLDLVLKVLSKSVETPKEGE